ncbi:MAG: class IIb bacteriocin, lactobin A/cerein 7B family [Oscillospiraceae bacterium]|nr:class IIb bacteriocin, lactobin A/cerein 7B family [Oscillospiraceae bacterium]
MENTVKKLDEQDMANVNGGAANINTADIPVQSTNFCAKCRNSGYVIIGKDIFGRDVRECKTCHNRYIFKSIQL